MFDLLIKGGTLPDGTISDIGIKGDRISAVGRLDGPAVKVIDATGDLVSPPFVDPHFHMDAVLSYGLPRVNTSGTLLEGIALWGELRPTLTRDALVDRALRWKELGEDDTGAPAQDEEFVLMHADNVQATGFLEHIKLPHYVDFQSELELIRRLRADQAA